MLLLPADLVDELVAAAAELSAECRHAENPFREMRCGHDGRPWPCPTEHLARIAEQVTAASAVMGHG